jgi:hypothetical protein
MKTSIYKFSFNHWIRHLSLIELLIKNIEQFFEKLLIVVDKRYVELKAKEHDSV